MNNLRNIAWKQLVFCLLFVSGGTASARIYVAGDVRHAEGGPTRPVENERMAVEVPAGIPAVSIPVAQPGGCETAGDGAHPDGADRLAVPGTKVMEENGRQGLMDWDGHILVPFQFDRVNETKLMNGCYEVGVSDGDGRIKTGLYEPGNGLLLPCAYNRIVVYPHCMVAAKDVETPEGGTEEKWGILSSDGQTVLQPFAYDSAFDRLDQAIHLRKRHRGNEMEYLFAYDGTLIADMVGSFGRYVNGYATFDCWSVQLRDRVRGIVNAEGVKTLLPRGYGFGMYAGIVSSGLIRVQDERTGKWGYMDTGLHPVIPAEYELVEGSEDFRNGMVLLRQDGDTVVLNSKGVQIAGFKEDGYTEARIDDTRPLLHVKRADGRTVCLDADGRVVVP